MRRRQALAANPAQFAINTVNPPDRRSVAFEGHSTPLEAHDVFWDFDALSDSSLADVYQVKFGKRPHHRMKRETIIKRLEQ